MPGGCGSAAAPANGASPAAAASAASASAAPSADFVPLIEIDEKQFDEDVTVVALQVPAKLCGQFIAHFKALSAAHAAAPASASASAAGPSSWLLVRPRISAVVDGPTKDVKYILLCDTIKSLADLSLLPAETRQLLAQHAATVTPCLYTFTLSYDYFTQDIVLQRLLPAGVQVPAGFETIGHIAHLNLSEPQLPWGRLIARVLLDKNPHLHTVVNKVGTISTQYRVFEMDVLGGVKSCRTEVREHGCTFVFDFSAVYWNSRLSNEHARLIDCFKPRQLVVDMMCGIGPFAVPAARALGVQKGFLGGAPAIYANDLNPDSFSSLKENLSRNKVASLVSAHNMDGRAFLWDVVRPAQLGKEGRARSQPIAHVLMNLPAIAIEFLDAFVGLYADEDGSADPAALQSVLASPPLVHAYCFSKLVEDPLSDLVPRVERAIGGKLPRAVWVKDVVEQSERKSKRQGASAGGKETVATKDATATDGAAAGAPAAAAAGAAASSSNGASSSSSSSAVGPTLIPYMSLPDPDTTYVRFVRNVAPNKDMFCVSFHVPRSVLTATPSYRTKQQQQQAATPAATAAPAVTDDASQTKRKLEDAEEQPAKKSKESDEAAN